MSVQFKEPLRSLQKCKKAWLMYSTIRGTRHHSTLPPAVVAGLQSRLIHSSKNAAGTTSHIEPQLIEEHSAEEQAYVFQTQKQQQQRSRLTSSSTPSATSQKQLNETTTSTSVMSTKQREDLMSSLADHAQWTKVIETFENSANTRPTPKMYLTALKAYGQTKQVNKILNTFDTYKFRFNLKPNAYAHYMKAVLDCQDIPTAIRVFRDIYSNPRLKTQPVVSQCLALLLPALIHQHCYHKDKFAQALKLVHAFIKVTGSSGQPGPWHAPSIRSITQLLWQGFWIHLPISSSRKMMEAIPAHTETVPLNKRTLEHLLEGYATMTQYLEAGEQEQIPIQIRDVFNLVRLACHQQFIEPSTQICNALMKLRNTSSAIDRHHFKAVLQWMKDKEIQPDAQTVALLIDRSNAHLISADRAKELYQMLKQQPTANGKVNSILCNTFVKYLSSEDVHQLEREALEEGIMIDPLAMIDGFHRRKEFEKGWAWLQQQQQQQLVTLDMYATFLEGLVQAQQWRRSIRYYTLLQQQLGQEKIMANRRLATCVLTAHLARNDMEGSLQLLKNLRVEMKPKHIHKIILTLCRLESDTGYPLVHGGHIVKSLRLMESTLHVYLDAERLARIILKLGHRGECRESFLLYKYIREGGHTAIRVRGGDSRIYRAMMSAATLNNRIDLLEQTWHQMLYRRCRFLSEKFEKEQPTLAAYNILLNGYASQLPRPDPHRIKRIYVRMLQQGLQPNLVTYNILIKTFVNCGSMDAAHQLFNIMMRENISVDDGDYKHSISSNTLLSGWIRQRQWDNVETFIKEHKDKLDMVTFNMIVQSFLHLNPKTVTTLKLLKYQHRWKVRDEFQREYGKRMSSDRIWNLFESVTGYTRQTIENIPVIPPSISTNISSHPVPALHTLLYNKNTNNKRKDKDGFIDAFVNLEDPDEATYNLFMKAFYQVNDSTSAKKIYLWMKHLQQQEIL